MRYARIPAPIDHGRHCESLMSYLWHNYTEHNKLLLSAEDYMLTVGAERYACGFPLPPFQRELCWTQEQEVAFIESAWMELPLGTYTHCHIDWETDGKPVEFSGWLVDGQQRLTTLQRYWEDVFPVYGLRFSELDTGERRRFMNIKFCHFEISSPNEARIRDLYNRMAFGGTQHSEAERA